MSTGWIILVAFVSMEAVSYLAHRFLMHGIGMVLHRSHHDSLVTRFEANDLFPVMFAAVTILAMSAGATLPSLHVVFIVGIGVTIYGAAYAFVHDVYIHARLGQMRPVGFLEYLKASHRIHHLYGGEPFGMLMPVVPKRLRARAESATYDPLEGRVTVLR